MSKKLIIVGMVLTFCAGFLSAQTAVAPSAGDGSEGNPYQIATLANLRWLSENSDKWASGICFIQTADIDASETQYWNDSTGFSPIGNSGIKFQGNYNGNRHTISGLYIDRPSSDCQGLFGYIYSGAEISNLGLLDVDISGTDYVGGLIGKGEKGNVSNCYASGEVNGNNGVGGLIAINAYSTVSNCYASGTVSGTDSVGGFMGANSESTITACFWDSTVNSSLNGVGGGYSGDQITGKTTSEMQTQSTYTDAGWKFIADIDTYHEGEEWHILADRYPTHAWRVIQTVSTLKANGTTETSATLNGGLHANGYATTVEFEWGTTDTYGNTITVGSYAANDYLDISTPISGLTPNMIYHYRIKATYTKRLIYKIAYGADVIFYAKAPAPDAGDGSSDNPYQIATLANLRWLSENSDKWASGICFIQTADIDASETQDWNKGEGFSPIGISYNNSFKGNYNGNGHTISGLYIDRPSSDYQGLFGRMDSDAEISDLGLVDANITGRNYVGGLIGLNFSDTVSNCYASGPVSGTDYVGGLIGLNSSGTVSNCYASGPVSGTDYVGGLIGRNYYSTVSNCYASGPVSGTEDVGGFMGANSESTITACFWDSTVNSSLNGVGGGYSGDQITGKTTSEMQTQSTYTDAGWDFIDTWKINGQFNNGYPFLKWQIFGVGIEERTIPQTSCLHQNYPNPFNPTTRLQYGLPEVTDVNLMIFDITGRKIKEWSISNQQPGWHEVIWNGTDQSGSLVSTGVYIYCLRAGNFIDTKKMVFMK